MPATTWVGSRLHALSPFGPIFGKELRVTSRRKRTYFLRSLYLLILFLILLSVWAGWQFTINRGGVAARLQAQQQLASAFFGTFGMFTIAAMMVIGPVLTATSISAERLGRTFDVLLMTPINTWQILSGKLFSRLLIAFTLIGLSLPVLALVRLLGTIELSAMIGAICLAAVTAMTSAAVGLFFSTFFRRGYAIILISYFVILFFYLFVPMLIAFFAAITRSNSGPWTLLVVIHPMLSMGTLIDAPFGIANAWVYCVLIHLALTAILVFISGLALRRVARRGEGTSTAPNPENNIPIAAASMPPALPSQALNYASAAKPAQQTKLREISDGNPVLWREIRKPLMAKRWQRIAMSLTAVAVLVTTYAMLAEARSLDEWGAQIAYAIFMNGLVWLVVAVLSATVISQEKESDTWTLLLTTPLKGGTIVWGKFLGVLRRMLWPFLLIVAHFLLFTITGIIQFSTFCYILWVIVSFNLIWIATGIYLSLRLRKTTAAVIVNLLLAIAAYGLTPLVLFLGGSLIANDRVGGRMAAQVAWYLPYYHLGQGVSAIENDDRSIFLPPAPWEVTEELNYNYNARVDAITYLAIPVAVGVIHIAIAAGILLLTARQFDRIVGRAAQRGSAVGLNRSPTIAAT